ncbi:MAG TPA: XdhC family protein [Candidatus Binatia bacterium]|nr:XdhC family protein [Candidatus Binatia bacterium]
MAASGRACALATVVRTESPTSAHPGDTAVIDAEGRLTGWIGGSCSEPLVRREALAAISDGQPRLVRIKPSDAVEEARAPGELTVATTCPSGGALDIFIDPQLPPPLLLVVGSSPAATALLRLAREVGFRTCSLVRGSAAAERTGADQPVAGAAEPDIPAAARPSADQTVTEDGLGALRDHRDTWVVVATMGHDDEGAVATVLRLPHADIALVASERRAAAVLGTLRGDGVPDAQLARVRSPAGVRRGGTQAEIALQALADIVDRRRERLALVRRGLAEPGVDVAAATSWEADSENAGVMAAQAGEPSVSLAFATDPVCGMTVDLAADHPRVELEGRTFHFCCEGCARRFRDEPTRYLPSHLASAG